MVREILLDMEVVNGALLDTWRRVWNQAIFQNQYWLITVLVDFVTLTFLPLRVPNQKNNTTDFYV